MVRYRVYQTADIVVTKEKLDLLLPKISRYAKFKRLKKSQFSLRKDSRNTSTPVSTSFENRSWGRAGRKMLVDI